MSEVVIFILIFAIIFEVIIFINICLSYINSLYLINKIKIESLTELLEKSTDELKFIEEQDQSQKF